MNIALWIVAGVMATVLLVSTLKIVIPRERIAAVGGTAAEWVLDFSPGALRVIGVLELLAVAGLILPAVLDIPPIMVPVTAVCVALLFTVAVFWRVSRGEQWRCVPDVVYLARWVVLGGGRVGAAPFMG